MADLVLNQLIGRLIYFHCLFIEPELNLPKGIDSVVTGAATSEPCCNHQPNAVGNPTVAARIHDSPWNALDDVRRSFPTATRCQDSGECCAECHIVASSVAVISNWVDTESKAYESTPVDATNRSQACAAAAVSISAAFSGTVSNNCNSRKAAGKMAEAFQPSTIRHLPLTYEFFTLWAHPARVEAHPVNAWLNHCTALSDIRSHLDQQGGRP